VETTLNAIGDAVITIDLSGQLRYLNAVAQHLIGGGQQVLGRYFEDVFSMIDLSGSGMDLVTTSQLRANSESKQTFPSLRLQGADGSSHMVSLVASPIRDAQGVVDGLVLVCMTSPSSSNTSIIFPGRRHMMP
jgi:PAS domain S-box-containing protein